MTISINKRTGHFTGAMSHTEVMVALAQAQNHALAAAATAITNNAGGTALALRNHTTLANEADDSTSLADATTGDAAIDTVHNALRELAAGANALATLLGITGITYNGGGAATDGTIAAVTVAIDAAATGIKAAETTVVFSAFDNAFYQIARLTNALCRACGVAELDLSAMTGFTPNNTVAAITISLGTPADPGLGEAAVEAALVQYRGQVTAVAAKLIALATTPTAKVVVV